MIGQPLPPSGIPNYVQPSTNWTNFGPELDEVKRDVSNILANQNTFFATLEAIVTQLVTEFNAEITNLNVTLGNLAQLLQMTILSQQALATAAGQQQSLELLQKIYESFAPLRATAVGIDPAKTATTPQIPPSKSGP